MDLDLNSPNIIILDAETCEAMKKGPGLGSN